jgi:hypothetical protein
VRDGILNQTIERVTDILGRDLDRIAVKRAVIGLFFTGVKLDESSLPGPARRRATRCPAMCAARYRPGQSATRALPADRRPN